MNLQRFQAFSMVTINIQNIFNLPYTQKVTVPHLMHVNTNYNMSIRQAIYINIFLFTKLNVHQFAFMLQFTKLTGHQIHFVYNKEQKF